MRWQQGLARTFLFLIRRFVQLRKLLSRPFIPEDALLLRGFLLELRGSGRAKGTEIIYGESVRFLSGFCRVHGMPSLANLTAEHVREFLADLVAHNNKPASVHARYRALTRFFKWMVGEGERRDNPMEKISPPRIPETIQPHYQAQEVEKVLRACHDSTVYGLRDRAMILLLYDTGVRAAELCGMDVAHVDWDDQTILVTGKAGKQRKVSFGSKSGAAIDRYLRKRKDNKSHWLWLSTRNQPMTPNALRMMLERRFEEAGVRFRGAHGFRRGFAISFLEGGGQEGDLKELAGWKGFDMVQRYARATASERATRAHKKFSPGDRLGVR
ncbi:MAG: tyrosine-type recombinase/integrase [Candidatus Marsarchaeota archaeon]|nr:tyrosine-type recombinase/integrase [Candidatus Marsarchaeota archaeon]